MKIKLVKAGALVFLALYLGFLCTRGWAKDIPIDEIAAKMEQDQTITTMEKCGARELRRFYGLEAKNLEGYFFYKAESPMSVDEFLVVKTDSPQGAEEVLDRAEVHLEEQKNSFEGYGVSQTALLSEAAVETRGSYVLYASGKYAQQWKKEFLDLIR
ncbi:DUF4358 domain-containing protein [Blautia marasmi]|uniref:DUF4358 domain-containing protein n=1 Tax=Blautia marasmi TaxID=1917868 RepID=UPI0025969589|nr:DUF4358 domain-containing protein [uncultured Blautia sp.]